MTLVPKVVKHVIEIAYVESYAESGNECPVCGAEIVGSIEVFHASLSYGRFGLTHIFEQDGETEADLVWGNQRTLRDDSGRVITQCINGHAYVWMGQAGAVDLSLQTTLPLAIDALW